MMKKCVNDVSEHLSTLSPVQISPFQGEESFVAGACYDSKLGVCESARLKCDRPTTKGEGAFAARSLPNFLREDV
jgi:hypothetical protein